MSIESMKQALEALNNAQHFIDEYAAAKYIHAHNAAITSLRQAIAEAEKQEHVAGTYWACERCNFACDKDERCPECGHHTLVQHDFHPQPAQPKREPLSAEQIAEIIGNDKYLTPSRIARAIEAAHGIIKTYPEKDKA